MEKSISLIDHKKAHDMNPQSWILHCPKMYKIPDEVIPVIETWTVELTVRGKNLPSVKIQRGIFQGNTLLSLVFVIAKMPSITFS